MEKDRQISQKLGTGCPAEGTEWDEVSCIYQGNPRVCSWPYSGTIPRSRLCLLLPLGVYHQGLASALYVCTAAFSDSSLVLGVQIPSLLLLTFAFSFQTSEHGSPTQHHLPSKLNRFPVKPSAVTGFLLCGPVMDSHSLTHLVPASNHQWEEPCLGV